MGAQMGPPEVGGQQGRREPHLPPSPSLAAVLVVPTHPESYCTQSLSLDWGLKVRPALAGLVCVSRGTWLLSQSLCSLTCATAPRVPLSPNARITRRSFPAWHTVSTQNAPTWGSRWAVPQTLNTVTK